MSTDTAEPSSPDSLRAAADELEHLAAWCKQSNHPSDVYGFVSAQELLSRAAALRAVATDRDTS